MNCSPRCCPRLFVVVLGVGLFAAGMVLVGTGVSRAEKEKLAERVFEMRTYYTHEAKLEHLHSRFRDHTNYLFVKHGMSLIGYWTPTDKSDTLIYILAYESAEAREKAWKGFLDDAEWKRVFKASHEAAGGPIVKKVESVYLSPTDYSPIR